MSEKTANTRHSEHTPAPSRRAFLSHAAAGAAGAGLLAACGADTDSDDTIEGAPAVQTGERIRWRCASSFPRGLDAIYGSAERLGEVTSALTGGRFEIRAYPAGELVPALQVMDAVQQGTVQVGHSTSYYYTGKNQALAFDTGIPFGMTARQQDAWLNEGGGLDVVRGVFADFGIITFPAGNTGAQMGGWFRREVNSPEDLRGLKMRIPGLGGEVMDRLGVTVQVLPGERSTRRWNAARSTRPSGSAPTTTRSWASTRPPTTTTTRVGGSRRRRPPSRSTGPRGTACPPTTRPSSRSRRRPPRAACSPPTTPATRPRSSA